MQPHLSLVAPLNVFVLPLLSAVFLSRLVAEYFLSPARLRTVVGVVVVPEGSSLRLLIVFDALSKTVNKGRKDYVLAQVQALQ